MVYVIKLKFSILHDISYKGMTSQQKVPAHVKAEAFELPIKRLFTGQEEKHASSLSKSSLDSNPSRRAHQNDGDSGPSQPLLRRFRLRCPEKAFIRESKVIILYCTFTYIV